MDSIFFLQISDTPFMDNMELSFVVINDPRKERYQIDRDPEGKDTLFGTALRNVPEEERAMKAGLAPGQVRPGLRLLKSFSACWNALPPGWDSQSYPGKLSFYHNAIQYENYGFGYLEGQENDGGDRPGVSKRGQVVQPAR